MTAKKDTQWWDLALPGLREGRVKGNVRSVGLNLPSNWLPLCYRAAKLRGISLSAYARRALMAFVVHDLGLDWYSTMEDEPGLRAWGDPASIPAKSAGHGFGRWRIATMEPDVD